MALVVLGNSSLIEYWPRMHDPEFGAQHPIKLSLGTVHLLSQHSKDGTRRLRSSRLSSATRLSFTTKQVQTSLEYVRHYLI